MTTAHVHLDFEIELDTSNLTAMLRGRDIHLDPAPVAAEAAEAAAEAAPPAANPGPPRSARAARSAQTNGAAEQTAAAARPTPEPPPAASPPRIIPSEEELRPLLSRMAAVHMNKVRGVTDMLERVGGHKRLVECPPDTWPAIKQACDDAIMAAGG